MYSLVIDCYCKSGKQEQHVQSGYGLLLQVRQARAPCTVWLWTAVASQASKSSMYSLVMDCCCKSGYFKVHEKRYHWSRA